MDSSKRALRTTFRIFLKKLQSSLYSFLSTKWGGLITIVLGFVVLNTLLHVVENVTNVKIVSKTRLVSTESEEIVRMYEDNLLGKSYRDELCYQPVDVVYTWVNGSDERHVETVRKYYREWFSAEEEDDEEINAILESVFGANPSSNSTEQRRNGTKELEVNARRYRENDELRYSMRSLEKHAGWIRNIYLVTNGQIPSWLNLKHPKVHIVQHKDIFLNRSNLPVFSSPAIEAHLHLIPGISDQFIYLNDDVLFGKDVYPEDFYSKSKGQYVFLSWDVPECNPGCAASWIGDGYCDVACNNSRCHWDGGDCIGVAASTSSHSSYSSNYWTQQQAEKKRKQCAPRCPNNWLGDKFCDRPCNVIECGFDSGDCGTEKMIEELKHFYLRRNIKKVSVSNETQSMYFNLTGLFGKDYKIASGEHNDSKFIRTSVISQKHRILTLTFFRDLEKSENGTSFPAVIEFVLTGEHRISKVKRSFKFLLMIEDTQDFQELFVDDSIEILEEPTFQPTSEEVGVINTELGIVNTVEEEEFVTENTRNEEQMPIYDREEGSLISILREMRSENKEINLDELLRRLEVMREDEERNIEQSEVPRTEEENEIEVVIEDEISRTTNDNEDEIVRPGSRYNHESDTGNEDFDLQPTDVDEKSEYEDQEDIDSREETLNQLFELIQNNKQLREEKKSVFQNSRITKTNTRKLLELDSLLPEVTFEDFGGDTAKSIRIVEHDKFRMSFRDEYLRKLESVELQERLNAVQQKMNNLRSKFHFAESRVNGVRNNLGGRNILADTFGDSLIHVNGLLDDSYGRQSRKVPAHMPHFINKHVMSEVHKKWEGYYNITAGNKFRSSNDMQYTFSYMYYLMSEGVKYDTFQFFNELDSNGNGFLEKYEIIHLCSKFKKGSVPLAEIQDLFFNITNSTEPTIVRLRREEKEEESILESNSTTVLEDTSISNANKTFEEIALEALRNITGRSHSGLFSSSSSPSSIPSWSYGSSTSSWSSSLRSERDKTMEYYDYVYEILTLFSNASDDNTSVINVSSFIESGLDAMARKYFDKVKGKYKYELKDLSEVGFFMIRDNDEAIFDNMESLRVAPKKFLCLNDDMNETHPNPKVIEELHNFLKWHFPHRSQFELEEGMENPYLYYDEMQVEFRLKKIRAGWVILIGAVLFVCLGCCCICFLLYLFPKFMKMDKKSFLRRMPLLKSWMFRNRKKIFTPDKLV